MFLAKNPLIYKVGCLRCIFFVESAQLKERENSKDKVDFVLLPFHLSIIIRDVNVNITILANTSEIIILV